MTKDQQISALQEQLEICRSRLEMLVGITQISYNGAFDDAQIYEIADGRWTAIVPDGEDFKTFGDSFSTAYDAYFALVKYEESNDGEL